MAAQIILDFRNADLSDQQRALCEYAVKLSARPTAHGPADLEPLRDSGLSDGQILLATQIIGYFNYINRMANALGVDPESWMQPSKQEWLQKKANFVEMN